MADSDHLKSEELKKLHNPGKKKGCVWKPCDKKGHVHRDNCYDYAKAALKADYNLDFTQGEHRARFERAFKAQIAQNKNFLFARSTKKDPRHNRKAWHIGYQQNFRSHYQPWRNQAHHVLPHESLLLGITSKNDLALILQAGYNINFDCNIVFLPERDVVAKAMQLYTHLGSHPKYSSRVKTIINKVKRMINKSKDPDNTAHTPLTGETADSLKDELYNWSKDEITDILAGAKKGRRGVPINKRKPVAPRSG